MATTSPNARPPRAAKGPPAEPTKTPTARPRSERRIMTPEGVPLSFQLAERGERAAAVLIDLVVMGLALTLVVLAVVFLLSRFGVEEVAIAVAILASFLIRTFYFIYFELRWQGATPGKRALGLRVIDRSGGYLRPDAIFARNILREVELFLPMTLLLAGPQEGSSGWFNLLTFGWISVFLLLPFFNRDRLRAGDIIAGTWVVSAPKALLLSDIAAQAKTPPSGQPPADPEFSFTRSQLEVYGIYELQTLEDVLRQKGPQAVETLDEVTKRIQHKIGWTGDQGVNSRRFLKAFYAALRSHLESLMLFGERRESKHDRKPANGKPDGAGRR